MPKRELGPTTTEGRCQRFLRNYTDDFLEEFFSEDVLPDALTEMIKKYVPADRLNSVHVLLVSESHEEAQVRYKRGFPKEEKVVVSFYDERLGQLWTEEFLLDEDIRAWRDAWNARMEEREERRHGPK